MVDVDRGIRRAHRATPDASWFRRVLVVAAVCTLFKLWIASHTYGTDDVRYWTGFLQGVARHGPIGIYGVQGFEAPYNHPPLIGWMLLAFSKLHSAGISFPFLIRAPASVADLFSSLLLYRLLRQVRSEREAGIAACLFATSPLLFVISGFHGNTDPAFIMFVLLAGYAVAVARRGFLGGVAIAVAISIKLTPVVMLPLLLVLAVRRGGQVWSRFLLGGAVVFTVVWVPALVLRGPDVTSQVLGYSGAGPRQWGLSQVARGFGASEPSIYVDGDHLRFLVVAAAALVPAALGWWRRSYDIPLLGLPLCLFLFLSPSFGYQYLTWALAPAFLLAPVVPAAVYSWTAGLTAIAVYSHWNHAAPWDWYEARSTPTPPALVPMLALTWLTLGVVCTSLVRIARGRGRPARLPTPSQTTDFSPSSKEHNHVPH